MESFSNSAIDQSDFRPRINHTPEYNTYLYVKRLQCYNISGLSEQTWCMYKPTTQRSVTEPQKASGASLQPRLVAGYRLQQHCRLQGQPHSILTFWLSGNERDGCWLPAAAAPPVATSLHFDISALRQSEGWEAKGHQNKQ